MPRSGNARHGRSKSPLPSPSPAQTFDQPHDSIPADVSPYPVIAFLQQQICDDPAAHLPGILHELTTLARREPWLAIPEDRRVSTLGPLALALVSASICEPADEDRQAAEVGACITAAVSHGAARRALGGSDEILFKDFFALREAVWAFLRRLPGADRTQAAHAILRTDVIAAFATRAALYGFHRAEIEDAGRWPGVLEQLVSETMRTSADRVPKRD